MNAKEDRREIIIMIDDDVTSLTIARNNLADKYNFFTAPSSAKLFQILKKVTPDLILLNIEMPDIGGYEVIRLLKSAENTIHIPVIFLATEISPKSEIKGLNLGAVDYIIKPFSREVLVKRIDMHLFLERQKNDLLSYSRNLKGEVDKKTRAVLELQNTMLRTIAELIERRDSVTGGHIARTQLYLKLLVDFLLEHGVYTDELSIWDIDLLIMSSQLHDVGKISIRDDILMKPGKLTNEEFDEMKKHTVLGTDIIRNLEESTTENAFLKYAGALAGSHHEKWDGSGYPYGLKGSAIPLMGRLMGIVDVYDALTNNRPYKKALSHEGAVEIIKGGLGSHFDPLIADVFLTHEEGFAKARFSQV